MVETYRTPGKRRRRTKGEGALYQRADGMWVGQVELEPNPDGTRNKSKPVYSKDKTKVIEKMAALKNDIENGHGQMSKQLTLGAWLDDWLENIARNTLGPDSYVTNRASVNNQIKPFVGKKILAEFSPADVRYMHRKILEKWATQTCANAHNTLSKALDAAMKERPPKVKFNACKLVDKPTVVNETRGALTAEQARKLLVTSYQWGDPLLTRWLFALLTGARQGECLGLTWDRIDFEKGSIDLQWQLQRLKLKPGADPEDPNRFDVRQGIEHVPLVGGYVLRRTKTKKARIVPLPEPLALILLAYREVALPNPYGLVWASEQSQPIRGVDDDAAWYDALARAELPRMVLHAARHTATTLLAELGVDEHTRMQITGHSTEAAHRGYTHVSIEAASKGMDKLAALLSIDG